MPNTLILYDGKMSSTERVAESLGQVIGHVRICEIQEGPESLADYEGVCLVFNFYGALTAGKTRGYLEKHREELRDKRLAFLGIGFTDSGFTKYCVDMEDLIGGVTITAMFIRTERQTAEAGYQIARRMQAPLVRCGETELMDRIEAFIARHRTLDLAVSSENFVRLTPLEYIYIDGEFYIITEGGLKFRGLLLSESVSCAIYDRAEGSDLPESLQMQAKAVIVERDSAEYWRILALKGMGKEEMAALPITLFVIKITPQQYAFLSPAFREKGMDVRQTLDTTFRRRRWEAGLAFKDKAAAGTESPDEEGEDTSAGGTAPSEENEDREDAMKERLAKAAQEADTAMSSAILSRRENDAAQADARADLENSIEHLVRGETTAQLAAEASMMVREKKTLAETEEELGRAASALIREKAEEPAAETADKPAAAVKPDPAREKADRDKLAALIADAADDEDEEEYDEDDVVDAFYEPAGDDWDDAEDSGADEEWDEAEEAESDEDMDEAGEAGPEESPAEAESALSEDDRAGAAGPEEEAADRVSGDERSVSAEAASNTENAEASAKTIRKAENDENAAEPAKAVKPSLPELARPELRRSAGPAFRMPSFLRSFGEPPRVELPEAEKAADEELPVKEEVPGEQTVEAAAGTVTAAGTLEEPTEEVTEAAAGVPEEPAEDDGAAAAEAAADESEEPAEDDAAAAVEADADMSEEPAEDDAAAAVEAAAEPSEEPAEDDAEAVVEAAADESEEPAEDDAEVPIEADADLSEEPAEDDAAAVIEAVASDDIAKAAIEAAASDDFDEEASEAASDSAEDAAEAAPEAEDEQQAWTDDLEDWNPAAGREMSAFAGDKEEEGGDDLAEILKLMDEDYEPEEYSGRSYVEEESEDADDYYDDDDDVTERPARRASASREQKGSLFGRLFRGGGLFSDLLEEDEEEDDEDNEDDSQARRESGKAAASHPVKAAKEAEPEEPEEETAEAVDYDEDNEDDEAYVRPSRKSSSAKGRKAPDFGGLMRNGGARVGGFFKELMDDEDDEEDDNDRVKARGDEDDAAIFAIDEEEERRYESSAKADRSGKEDPDFEAIMEADEELLPDRKPEKKGVFGRAFGSVSRFLGFGEGAYDDDDPDDESDDEEDDY